MKHFLTAITYLITNGSSIFFALALAQSDERFTDNIAVTILFYTWFQIFFFM